MEHANTFVFQEIALGSAIWYLWYKLANPNNAHEGIIPDKLLTPDEHWDALSYE